MELGSPPSESGHSGTPLYGHPYITDRFVLPVKKIINLALQTLVTCAFSIYFVSIMLTVDIVLSYNDDRFPSVHSIFSIVT